MVIGKEIIDALKNGSDVTLAKDLKVESLDDLFEEETVNTVYSVIEEAKCLENGNGLYTSNEFINSAFSVQT